MRFCFVDACPACCAYFICYDAYSLISGAPRAPYHRRDWAETTGLYHGLWWIRSEDGKYDAIGNTILLVITTHRTTEQLERHIMWEPRYRMFFEGQGPQISRMHRIAWLALRMFHASDALLESCSVCQN